MMLRETRPQRGSRWYKSNGHMHTGKQNHRCKVCGQAFVLTPEKSVITEEQRADPYAVYTRVIPQLDIVRSQVGPHDQSYRTGQLHVTPTRFPVGTCHVVVFEDPCSSHRGHHIFRLQLQPHQGCSITRIAPPKLSGTMPPVTVTICDFQHGAEIIKPLVWGLRS